MQPSFTNCPDLSGGRERWRRRPCWPHIVVRSDIMTATLVSRKSPAGGLRNRALAVLVASLILFLSIVAHAPPARADSTLVQQNNGGCATTSCSPSPISFPSPVTAGDVVVVAIAVYSGSVGSVGDSFGSTFTLVAEASSSPIDVYIYDATLSSSGSDSIFVTFFGATQGGVYIYEVSGVTTVGAVFKVGGGDCYPFPSSEPSMPRIYRIRIISERCFPC